MKRDYDPLDDKKSYEVANAYGGPLNEDLFTHEDRNFAHRHMKCVSQVGRVIVQKGLEGALVLSYKDDKFEIQLSSGEIKTGTWDHWAGTFDSDGISSDGWTVGEIKPSWFVKDETPF